jgi:hypothetical protein
VSGAIGLEELATDVRVAGDCGEGDGGAGAIKLGERGSGTLLGVDGAVSVNSTAPRRSVGRDARPTGVVRLLALEMWLAAGADLA